MGLEKIKVSELGVVQDASGFLAFGITGDQNKALNIEAAFNSMIASFANGLVDWTNASANFSTTGTGQFGGDLSANNLSGTNTGDQASGDFDHNSLQNTHNLTTDIDHDQLANYVANQHIDWTNATVDLSTLGNLSAANLSGINTGDQQSSDFDHDLLQNSHNLTDDIDHNQIANSHNLTTDIDHNLLSNYVANEHIDWTNASASFHTTGTTQIDNATTISGTLTVNGDIVQNGASYITYPEEVRTNNDFIYLREGAVGGLSAGQHAGFQAMLYDGVNSGMLAIDAQGWARVGDVGDLNKVATMEENPTNGYFSYWDSANNYFATRQITASDISDLAFSNGLTATANGAKLGGSLTESTNIFMGVYPLQFDRFVPAGDAHSIIFGQNNKPLEVLNNSTSVFSVLEGGTTVQDSVDITNSTDSSKVFLRAQPALGGYLWMHDNTGVQKVEITSNGDSYFNGGKVGFGGVPTIAQMEIFTSSTAPFYVKNSQGETRLATSLTNDDADIFLYDRNDVLQVALRSQGDSYFGQGNLGVGTSTFDSAVDGFQADVGDGKFGLLLTEGVNRRLGLYKHATNGGQIYMYNDDNTLTTFITANGDSYFNGGNLGINKSPSLATLDVNGTGYFSSSLTAENVINSVNATDSGSTQCGTIVGSGGYLLAKDVDGVNSVLLRGYSASGTQAYFKLGGVAIGGTSAREQLDIIGSGSLIQFDPNGGLKGATSNPNTLVVYNNTTGGMDFNTTYASSTLGGYDFSTGGISRFKIKGDGAATFSNTVKSPRFIVNGAAGNYRGMTCYTNDSTRWAVYTDSVAESGSNAGSNFSIYRYSDSGAYLGRSLEIKRNTGAATFDNTVTATDFIIA